MVTEFSLVAEVRKEKKDYVLYEIRTGQRVDVKVPFGTNMRAYKDGSYIGRFTSSKGNIRWKRVKKDEVPDSYSYMPNVANSVPPTDTENLTAPTPPDPTELRMPADSEIREMVKNAMSLKPEDLEIDELNWKLAIRCALRGGNMMIYGFSGCGKTLTAQAVAAALKRPFFYFNMGAMQDARASLIGNTHFSPDKGTFFSGSEFVTAISTPFAVILCDEESRESHDAENILISVKDKNQRYLRIDEDKNSPVVHVAMGVTFISTANVGAEFTSTRILDRATLDRYDTIIWLNLLNKEQEIKQMRLRFPELNPNYINAFADIAIYTRDNMLKSDNPSLSTLISTRSVHEQCRLAMDGFRFSEVMEALVYQMFNGEGGVTSERSEMRRMANQHSDIDGESALISENKKKDKTVRTKVQSEPDEKKLFDINNDAL